MATLICGSLAFDTIMGFEGRFADQLLAEQLHILNVSFLVPTLRRDWGGCAGNIAYAMKCLGGEPLPAATLGRDGEDYLARLRALGIRSDFLKTLPDAYTAQAMIMTDRDNNQITAFHPGAMARAHENVLPARLGEEHGVRLAIISPDGREAMLGRAEQLAAQGIAFVFDPGQGLPMFDGPELEHFIDLAAWVAVNDYEAQMLSERTGLSLDEISRRVKGLIVTLGAQGVDLWQAGVKTHIPAVKPAATLDPTGCGDAWRGALLYGLERGLTLEQCALLGNRVGAVKVAARGPQNYKLDAPALLDLP